MAKASEPSKILVCWMEVDHPPATVVANWRAHLDAAEQAQADRFHFDDDRSTYIAAHWLIRNALTSVDGLAPTDWRFTVEEYGKPAIDPALGRHDLRFNLSHVRGFVACAVTTSTTIGIDVETLSPKHGGLDVADRFFSPSEGAILRATASDQQLLTFFRLWTLKEALIKATGEGLHRPLDSFSFSLDPTTIRFHPEDADEAVNWTFVEHRPTPSQVLALAIRQPLVPSGSLAIRRVSGQPQEWSSIRHEVWNSLR
jgi:4'-phosphopantetheinyl transferase